MAKKSTPAEELWRIADELRDKGKEPNLLDVAQEALNRGIELTAEDLNVSGIRKQVAPFTPKFIPTFTIAYLRAFDALKPDSLLDIWAGIGNMSAPIVQAFDFSTAVALEKNPQAFEIGSLLKDASHLEWRLVNPEEELTRLDETFDVIVGNVPLGMKRARATFDTDRDSITVKDELGRLLILKACRLLNEDGVGFFTMTPNFLFRNKSQGMRNSLNKLGLFLEAVLSLPAGWLSSLTSLPGLLLIIRKQPQNKVFLAELADDASQAIVLENLIHCKNGKLLQQGVWVDPSSNLSLDQRVKEAEIQKLKKQYPYPWVDLEDCATIMLPKRNKSFEDVPHAIYLPMLGNSPAATSVDDLKVKAQNVAQLILDPEKANASFLAQFLNSPTGMKVREAGYMGIIPRITKRRLLQLEVPLPDLATQGNILHIQAQLEETIAEAKKLKRILWSQPVRYKKIENAAKKIGKEDKLEDWIETLPFPLASILRHYHADGKPEHKVSHLLRFFEAFAQFRTTILLSAFAADAAFYVQEMENCIDSSQHQGWYKRATFGGWNAVGNCLASKTRSLLGDEEKRQHCLRLFADPERFALDALINKNLSAMLDHVKKYRDDWKGHGGIAGKQETQRRLKFVEIELLTIRQILSDTFTFLNLVAPGINHYTEGIYHYTVQSLKGSSTPFREIKIQTSIPLDKQKLYLLPTNRHRAVKLLPLFRIIENPGTQQKACYFYNRLEGDDVRWVSYHYEHESVIVRPDSELMKALAFFDVDILKGMDFDETSAHVQG